MGFRRHRALALCVLLSWTAGCDFIERLQEEERKAQDEALGEALEKMALEGLASIERDVGVGVDGMAELLEDHPYRGGPAADHREHPSVAAAAEVAEALRAKLHARCIAAAIEVEGERLPVSTCADDTKWTCEGEGIGSKYPLRTCRLTAPLEISTVTNTEARRSLPHGTLHVEIVDIGSTHANTPAGGPSPQ